MSLLKILVEHLIRMLESCYYQTKKRNLKPRYEITDFLVCCDFSWIVYSGTLI